MHNLYDIRNRKICFSLIKKLRHDDLNISIRYIRHDLFYLLQINNLYLHFTKFLLIKQHVVLIIVKTYFIQFVILFDTSDFQFNFSIKKFVFYLYFIFETYIFFWNIFELSINVDQNFLIREISYISLIKKSQLFCKFYSQLNAFAIILELWNHIYYKHNDINIDKRFNEIKQIAFTIRAYWKYVVENKKKNRR